MQTYFPRLINPETKTNIFPLVRTLKDIQQAYTLATPLQPAYIWICARKSKLNVRFPCHDRRSLIFGLPYTRNVLTRPFGCILKAIKKPILSYGKGRENSTLRAKLLWRNYYFIIESASLCPLSLNIVFSPQALPSLMENLFVSLI
jgi:hypothetical protein